MREFHGRALVEKVAYNFWTKKTTKLMEVGGEKANGGKGQAHKKLKQNGIFDHVKKVAKSIWIAVNPKLLEH